MNPTKEQEKSIEFANKYRPKEEKKIYTKEDYTCFKCKNSKHCVCAYDRYNLYEDCMAEM